MKQGLLLNTIISHLSVWLSFIQKLQVIFQVFRGPRLQNSMQSRKMEKPNSLENRVPHGARCCKPVTAPPSSCLHRPKGWRFMHSQEPNGKRVGGNVCMTVQESSMAIEIKRKAAGTIRLKVTDNN